MKDVRPGDLVLTSPAAVDLTSDGLELYSADPWESDPETDHEACDLDLVGTWRHSSIGVVIKSYEEAQYSGGLYWPVQVLVDGMLGWTYSDMLTVLGADDT